MEAVTRNQMVAAIQDQRARFESLRSNMDRQDIGIVASSLKRAEEELDGNWGTLRLLLGDINHMLNRIEELGYIPHSDFR